MDSPIVFDANKPERAVGDGEMRSAIELLRQLIPAGDFSAFDLETSPATVYTTLATLWLITLQRLGGGTSLVQAVKQLKQHHLDLLPNNKRVREGRLSERSGSFSRARSRLPLETARRFTEHVSHSLIERSPPWFAGYRAFLIDGTTFTLEPTAELRKLFPPATNQFGESVWPLLQMLVVHELQSGCALIPEIGAMYGPDNTSEAKMAAAIAGRMPRESLVLADAGFGIFSVAWAMRQEGHHLLLRLQKSRFKAMLRTAQRLPQIEIDAAGTIRNVDGGGTVWRLEWRPSPKDRLTNPTLPADAVLSVFVHETTLPNGEALYLVTDLEISTADARECYRRRYDVEFDIRDLKVTLGLEKMRAKSHAMLQKELLCGLVAYNLVQHLRREAAAVAKVPPRRLSFTGVWTTFQTYLLHQPPCDYAGWQARYQLAIQSAAQAKLPNRPHRKYPRQAHPRRPKTTYEKRRPNPPRPKTTPPDIPK